MTPTPDPPQTDRATCKWTQDEDGVWNTACDKRWEFTVGGPKDNGVKFCCYCGRPLKEKPYVE